MRQINLWTAGDWFPRRIWASFMCMLSIWQSVSTSLHVYSYQSTRHILRKIWPRHEMSPLVMLKCTFSRPEVFGLFLAESFISQTNNKIKKISEFVNLIVTVLLSTLNSWNWWARSLVFLAFLLSTANKSCSVSDSVKLESSITLVALLHQGPLHASVNRRIIKWLRIA